MVAVALRLARQAGDRERLRAGAEVRVHHEVEVLARSTVDGPRSWSLVCVRSSFARRALLRSFRNDSCAGLPWTTTRRPLSSSMPSPPGTVAPVISSIEVDRRRRHAPSLIRNSLPLLVSTTTSLRALFATMPLTLNSPRPRRGSAAEVEGLQRARARRTCSGGHVPQRRAEGIGDVDVAAAGDCEVVEEPVGAGLERRDQRLGGEVVDGDRAGRRRPRRRACRAGPSGRPPLAGGTRDVRRAVSLPSVPR